MVRDGENWWSMTEEEIKELIGLLINISREDLILIVTCFAVEIGDNKEVRNIIKKTIYSSLIVDLEEYVNDV